MTVTPEVIVTTTNASSQFNVYFTGQYAIPPVVEVTVGPGVNATRSSSYTLTNLDTVSVSGIVWSTQTVVESVLNPNAPLGPAQAAGPGVRVNIVVYPAS